MPWNSGQPLPAVAGGVSRRRSALNPLRLTSVSVSAWQDNLPPVITSFTQEYLKEIHLGGMNNHSDNITQTFRSGLQAEFSRNSTADHLAGPERAAVGRPVRVFTWEGTDPNGDRLVYDLDYRRRGEEAWRADPRPSRGELLGSWDTSEVPDGLYDLRLTASDRPDNPAGTGREVAAGTRARSWWTIPRRRSPVSS